MVSDYFCNNMNEKEFAKHIEELTGLDCYNDDIGTNEFNFGDFGELGITIEENNRISIFRSFGYYDLPQDEQDKESQESDNLSYAQESAFYFFLKCNQEKFAVSQWDDGGYMCPGYVAVFIKQSRIFFNLAPMQPNNGVKVFYLPIRPLVKGTVNNGVIISCINKQYLIFYTLTFIPVKKPK